MRSLALFTVLLVIFSGCEDPKPKSKVVKQPSGQPDGQAAAKRIIEQSQAESKRVVRKEAEPKPVVPKTQRLDPLSLEAGQAGVFEEGTAWRLVRLIEEGGTMAFFIHTSGKSTAWIAIDILSPRIEIKKSPTDPEAKDSFLLGTWRVKEKKSIRGTDIFTLVDSVEKDESDEGPKEKKPTLKDVEREVVGLGYYKSEKEAATHKKKALALLVEMIDDCGPDREGQVRKARLAFRYIFVNSYGLGGRSMPGLPFDGFALLRNQRFLPDESGAEYRAAENWRKDLIARGRKEALRDAVFKNKP